MDPASAKDSVLYSKYSIFTCHVGTGRSSKSANSVVWEYVDYGRTWHHLYHYPFHNIDLGVHTNQEDVCSRQSLIKHYKTQHMSA